MLNHSDADVEIKISTSESKVYLSEDDFWDLIKQLDWKAGNNDEITAPLITKLAKLPTASIYLFQEILSQKLHALDTLQHAQNIGNASYSEAESFSSNHFIRNS